MTRCVEPEWLDELSAADPQAEGSRRDLRRLNAWMGNTRVIAGALGRAGNRPGPAQLIELGAGDGTFLLSVARALGPRWAGTRATLIDRQAVVSRNTIESFAGLAWQIEQLICDVFDWCTELGPGSTLVLANLFLHHLNSQRLQTLFANLAPKTSFFVAVEPRRSALSLLFSRLVGMIGCNAVTRHDAPTSVRAGFRGTELSCCWPAGNGWLLEERAAGAFSHLFVAQRRSR